MNSHQFKRHHHSSYSNSFNLSNVGEITGVESERAVSKFRNRRRKFLCFHPLHIKRALEIWSVLRQSCNEGLEMYKKTWCTCKVIECFHMTSRRPYWCLKTMKRGPCWCPKPILWELNTFLMQTLSFVSINLHRCWPHEWKHSIVLLM